MNFEITKIAELESQIAKLKDELEKANDYPTNQILHGLYYENEHLKSTLDEIYAYIISNKFFDTGREGNKAKLKEILKESLVDTGHDTFTHTKIDKCTGRCAVMGCDWHEDKK